MKDTLFSPTFGIYEQLITQLIERKLNSCEINHEFYIERNVVNAEEAALFLSRFLQQILQTVLSGFTNTSEKNGESSKTKLEKQIELANDLIFWLRDYLNQEDLSENLIDSKGQLLKAIFSTQNPIAANLKHYITDITPLSGLSQSELFTGSNVRLSLDTEIKREIVTIKN
jgi:hypothetical protein